MSRSLRTGSYLLDLRPLRIPAYRRLWTASVISAVGGSFSLIAVPSQLFALTGSSSTIAAASATSFVALAVASLWGGALADAMDRRRLLLLAHAVQALTYLLLGVLATRETHSLAVLMVLVGAQGLALGAIMTTMGATVPRVVPPELLPAATSLSSLVRYTGSITGPLLAGVLIPAVGLGPLYLCDAIALIAVLWAVFRLPPIPPGPRPGGRPLAGQVIDGLGYLFAQPVLIAVLAVDLAAMVLGMPVALFSELAHRLYGGPAEGGPVLGLLYAAYPIGVLLAGLLSGTFTHARRHGAWMASAAIAWGLAVVLFGLAPHLAPALIALTLGGAINVVLSTFRNAITQAHTDDALRGRTQGTLTIVLIGGPQMSNVLHALAGSAIGARWAVCLGGMLTMATVTTIVRAVPYLWHYRADYPGLTSSAVQVPGS